MNKPVPKIPGTTSEHHKFVAPKKIDTHEEKIRKGQALNLAANEAVADKDTSTKHIVKLFVKYYDLAEMLQGTSIDEIRGLNDEN